MKSFGLILLLAIPALSFAQISTGITTTTNTSTLGSKLKKAGLGITLENETYTSSNKDEIAGYTSYMLISPNWRIDSRSSLAIGAQYDIREHDNKDDESKNRDHLSESFVTYAYKTLQTKEGSPFDLTMQARLYNTEDEFFKKMYSNDGNFQLRSFFGFPLAGKFYINKYTTYLRYKKYDVNDNINKYTREYELRARVSPTYNLTDKLALASTVTYNHIFMTEKTDSEDLDLGLSARYTPSRTYAIMVRMDYETMNTKENGNLTRVENIGDTASYALTLSAYY